MHGICMLNQYLFAKYISINMELKYFIISLSFLNEKYIIKI